MVGHNCHAPQLHHRIHLGNLFRLLFHYSLSKWRGTQMRPVFRQSFRSDISLNNSKQRLPAFSHNSKHIDPRGTVVMTPKATMVIFLNPISKSLSFNINRMIFHICLLSDRSIDKRNDSLSGSHGIAKLLAVVTVDGSGAWHKIGCRPNDKEPCCRSCGKDGEACPFHQLTKIVG